MEFGEYLRKLRKAKKLTLRDAAKLAGISHPYLSQLENGRTVNPSVTLLVKLAKALDVSYTDLLKKAGYASDDDKDILIDGEYMNRIENWKEKVERDGDFFEGNPALFGTDLEEVLKEAPQVYYGNKLLTRKEQKKIITIIELMIDNTNKEEKEKTLKLITSILE